jgi:hypothetical protein
MYKICRRTPSFYVRLNFKKLDIYRLAEDIANNIKALISFELFCLNAPIFGTNYAINMPTC